MRKTLLVIVVVLSTTMCYAQMTEFSVSLNSGLFSFRGTSTVKSSSYYISAEYNYPLYGSKDGLSYGVSMAIKRVTNTKILVGLDAGYEMLRSKVAIDAITYAPYSSSLTPARGQTYLNNSFINLFPYSGYRFSCSNNFDIDLTGGIDFGFCTNSTEKSKVKDANGKKYKSSIDRKTINTDIRPRVQITTYYKNFGVYAGYSLGLVNYKSGYIGGTNDAYSNLIRFGLTFRLNN